MNEMERRVADELRILSFEDTVRKCIYDETVLEQVRELVPPLLTASFIDEIRVLVKKADREGDFRCDMKIVKTFITSTWVQAILLSHQSFYDVHVDNAWLKIIELLRNSPSQEAVTLIGEMISGKLDVSLSESSVSSSSINFSVSWSSSSSSYS